MRTASLSLMLLQRYVATCHAKGDNFSIQILNSATYVTNNIFRYFTIVGSKLMRHNSKYHVAVTSQGYDVPQTLEIAIRNSSKEEGIAFESAQNVILINGQIQKVEFDVSLCEKFFFST